MHIATARAPLLAFVLPTALPACGEGGEPTSGFCGPDATSLTITPAVLQLDVDETGTLEAQLWVGQIECLSVYLDYHSEDATVASVERNGDNTATVTAVGAGTTAIRAFYGDGFSAEAQVTVRTAG